MIIDTLSRSCSVRSASTLDAALAQLVSRCADQDVAALELLYRRTSPWISHLIAQRTMSPADIDDTLVAVYAAVWRRAPDFAAMNRTALAWATSITLRDHERADTRDAGDPHAVRPAPSDSAVMNALIRSAARERLVPR